MMDGRKIKKRLLQAASVDNIDELFVANPPPNPAVIKAMMELQLEKQELDVKTQSEARKQAHEEASLQLRARHDVALIEGEQARALLARAQAIEALALADKAVGQTDVAWASHALEVVKAQMDAAANADIENTSANLAPQIIQPGTPEANAAPAAAMQQGAPQQ
jgi:hypothetical protein